MQGNKDSKGKSEWLQVIGTTAAILVVAGVVGIPFDILAAITLGAALVLIANPGQ